MLVAVRGRQGAGKTLTISVLTRYIGQSLGLNQYANYGLYGAYRLQTFQDFMRLDCGVVGLDEFWLWADSRKARENVDISEWVLQTRKKGLLVLMTAQNFHQLDVRVRDAIQFLVTAERDRKTKQITLSFVDLEMQGIGKRYRLNEPARFYDLFDSYETLKVEQNFNQKNELGRRKAFELPARKEVS